MPHTQVQRIASGAIATAAYAAGELNNTAATSSSSSSSTAASNTSSTLAAALTELQLRMGTAAPSSLSLLLEPAFFPEAG